MTRSAMTVAAALLLSAAGLLGACAGPKSAVLVHPEKVQGAPICSSCHDAGRAASDHDARWMKTHGAVAVRDQRSCEMCHQVSSCADCHGNKEEIKPSDKRDRPLRRDDAAPRRLPHPAPGRRAHGPGLLLPLPRTQERGEVRHMSQIRRFSTVLAIGCALLALLAVGCSKKNGVAVRPGCGAPRRLLPDAPRRVPQRRGGLRPVPRHRPARRHLDGELLFGLPRRPDLPPGRPRGPPCRVARAALGESRHRGVVRRLPRQHVEQPGPQLLQQQPLSRAEVRPPRRLALGPLEHRPVAGLRPAPAATTTRRTVFPRLLQQHASATGRRARTPPAGSRPTPGRTTGQASACAAVTTTRRNNLPPGCFNNSLCHGDAKAGHPAAGRRGISTGVGATAPGGRRLPVLRVLPRLRADGGSSRQSCLISQAVTAGGAARQQRLERRRRGTARPTSATSPCARSATRSRRPRRHDLQPQRSVPRRLTA